MDKTKEQFLKESGTLNPRPKKIKEPRFRSSEFFDPNDLLQVRYELVRDCKQDTKTLSEIARAFGVTRLTVYRLIENFENYGLAGLLPKQRGPKGASKVTFEILSFVNRLVIEDPDKSKTELLDEIREKFGVKLHRRTLEKALKKNLSDIGENEK